MIATLTSVSTIVEVDLRFVSVNVIHDRSFKSSSHLHGNDRCFFFPSMIEAIKRKPAYALMVLFNSFYSTATPLQRLKLRRSLGLGIRDAVGKGNFKF